MKTILAILLGLTLFTYYPSFIHAREYKYPEDVSPVEIETLEYTKHIHTIAIYYRNYDQLIVRVYQSDKFGYDEEEFERAFNVLIHDWMKNEDHRYYHYQITDRKLFYHKKINNELGTYVVYEIYMNLTL